MGTKPRKDIDQETRNVVARSAALLEAYVGDPSQRAFSARIGIANSTLRHILSAEIGTTVDQLAALCRAVRGLEPWMLLRPDFDPAAPGFVRSTDTRFSRRPSSNKERS